MFTINASVEWIDEEVCVTHLTGHNLPPDAVEPLMEWALALDLGCATEELGWRGWDHHPDGPQYVEAGEWVLDWNSVALREAKEAGL
jgi:hypothetical protein